MSRRIVIILLWIGMFSLIATTIPTPQAPPQKRTSMDVKIRKVAAQPDFKQ